MINQDTVNSFILALHDFHYREKPFQPEQQRECVYIGGLSCRVYREPDGSFSVDTPISYERNFSSSDDAIAFADSYGRIDRRK